MHFDKTNIIIAFDGPDNVGKGTQIALLRKHFSSIPFVISNLDKPVGETDSEKINYGIAASKNHLIAKHAVWEKGIPQIVDRMHYTEYAYSILRGGHSIETILELESDFSEMKDSFFTLIFIDEVQNIQSRDDGKSNYDVDNTKQIEIITQRFIEISKQSLFDNVIVNIHGKDISTVQNEVLQALCKKFPNLQK